MDSYYWVSTLVFLGMPHLQKLKLALSIRHPTLKAAALGFKEVTQEELPMKCKRGLPMRAKNKKEKVVKKVGVEPLCLTYLVSSSAIPCPIAKGKEKVLN